MTENHPRWRAAQRELEATVAAHPYQREADELIKIVFDNHFNSAKRTLAVADWLREYVAAREFGCTGLTTDPDGPSLVLRRDEALDGLRERAEDEEALADTPDLSGAIYGPELPSVEDWARMRRQARLQAGESLTTIQREVMEELIRNGAIIREGEELGPE